MHPGTTITSESLYFYDMVGVRDYLMNEMTNPRPNSKQGARLEQPPGPMTLFPRAVCTWASSHGPSAGISVSLAFAHYKPISEHGTTGTQGVKPALQLGALAHGVLPDNKANESLLAVFSCTITFNHHLHSR